MLTKHFKDPDWVSEFELSIFPAHQSYNKYVMTYNVSATKLLPTSGTEMENVIRGKTCEEEYVGETLRAVSVRCKEHHDTI